MSINDLYELVKIFGLTVDLDRWEEKGWIRVKSLDWPDDFGYRNNCLILYREDGEETIVNELRQSLIHLGENLKAKEIRKSLKI
jgi:hypothetical protein